MIGGACKAWNAVESGDLTGRSPLQNTERRLSNLTSDRDEAWLGCKRKWTPLGAGSLVNYHNKPRAVLVPSSSDILYISLILASLTTISAKSYSTRDNSSNCTSPANRPAPLNDSPHSCYKTDSYVDSKL